MKSSFDYSEFFQRNDKIMTNSITAALPLLLLVPAIVNEDNIMNISPLGRGVDT